MSRRQFILVGASSLLLSACQAAPAPSVPVSPAAAARYAIGDLLRTTPFYVAHRGSGDNWVEHSLDSYSRSIGSGATAIEVSVSATSDGVFVCHHDLTTKRMTGVDLTIAEVTWKELSQLRSDATAWLGPAAKQQPLPLLADVLNAFAATHVIFLEDKQGTNTEALLELMDSYPQSTEHVIWKQWAGAAQYALVDEHGYTTWGYFTPELYERADELAPRFDLLGVSHRATDAQVATLVGYGKPVIAWEVHFRSMRDRMSDLGVAGMMCSNLPYVTGTTAASQGDAFGTGLRAAGDLPWTVDAGTRVQPVIDGEAGSVTLDHHDVQSYLMGSMCPVGPGSYRITCELRWPGSLPRAEQHAGIAFGIADDRPYRVRVATDVSGYHLVLRANGSLELFSRAAGSTDGTRLKMMATAPPRAAEWVRLQLEVLANSIRILRLDGEGWSMEIDDASNRGGYFWLCKNYPGEPPVEFRSIVVS
ncbi:glycerophosphodiester phosphodiesterase family protein [Cryobacterium sp. TmT3-12]|nr:MULTISPECIES: glycerophosphodiester phosphodiesterase family protein [Cryobacterium]